VDPTATGEERIITEQRKDRNIGPQEGAEPELAGAVPPVENPEADDPWKGFTLDSSVFRSAGGQNGS
jgi:hypothetical protein